MQHLNDYSFDRLRLAVPVWSNSVPRELLGKIKATLIASSKKMTDDEQNSLIRKWAIIRHELFRRIRVDRVTRWKNHQIQEKIIWDTRETALKESDWRHRR